MTRMRVGYPGLLFGRFAGLVLGGAGAFAGLALYSEFKVWTDVLYIRIALLIPTSGAVAFALMQGGRMFFAKTTADLGIAPDLRVFAAAVIVSELLVGLLLHLPDATATGPDALIVVVLQTAVLIIGLVPALLSGQRRRRDGA